MMNLLAIALLLSTLATSGVWSPQPAKPSDHPDHLIKEGHSLLVVKYERVVPSTISPQTSSVQLTPSTIIDEAREKLHEAASVLPNLGQGLSTPQSDKPAPAEPEETHHHVRDRICDAYGVCKDTITGIFSKSKDKAKDAAANIKDDIKEKVEGIKEKASHEKEQVMEIKDRIEEKGSEFKGKAEEARRNVTDILQRGRDVLYDAGSYVGWDAVLATVHMMAFATAYGTCMWVTFMSSHVLAGALPRQQFGVVQSRLYPMYFRAMAYSIGVALVSYYFGVGRRKTAAERWQNYNLLAGLGMVLANMFFLEPKATKVMFESMKMEKEEGRGRDMADIMAEATAAPTQDSPTAAFATRRTSDQEALKSSLAKLHGKLKKLNSYSSLLNIITLMGLTWHLMQLSGRLNCQ